MLYKQQNLSSNINNIGGGNGNSSIDTNNIAPFQLVGHNDEITSIGCYHNPIANSKLIENSLTSNNYSNSIVSTLPFLLISTSLDHTIKL